MKNAFRWYLFAVSCVISFRGRAGRTEIWSYFFFETLILLLCGLADIWLSGFPILLPTYAALTLIPTILVMIRRLHDCDFSGWWSPLALIPPICFFVMSWAPDPFQPNRFGTTERLPRREEEDDEDISTFDGVEFLHQPTGASASREEMRKEQYRKDLQTIEKSDP